MFLTNFKHINNLFLSINFCLIKLKNTALIPCVFSSLAKISLEFCHDALEI